MTRKLRVNDYVESEKYAGILVKIDKGYGYFRVNGLHTLLKEPIGKLKLFV